MNLMNFSKIEDGACEVCGEKFDENSTIVETEYGAFAHEDCCVCCSECGTWVNQNQVNTGMSGELYCDGCSDGMIHECSQCGSECSAFELVNGLCENCDECSDDEDFDF